MKKIYALLILLVILLVQSEVVLANQTTKTDLGMNFETFDREDGLSNLSVSSVVQDKYGFLWFGTQGGLNRYDGNDVVVIRNNPFAEAGLVQNVIQTMYYDEENHDLWIGTYQGISRYIISEDRFISYTVADNKLSNPIVIAITKDINGDMWFGTMSGLNKLDQTTGTFVSYDVPGNVVRDLLVDSSDRLLIGTYEGLHYFDYDEATVASMELDLPSPNVMVVKEFEPGTITMGLWDGGVVEVDIKTNHMITKSYEDNRVYSLIQTNDGRLWVGTWGGGLFIEDSDGKVTHYGSGLGRQSLSHDIIYSMYQDHSEIVWVGTNGGGIDKMNPRKNDFVEVSFDAKDGNTLSKGKINKVFEDRDGKIWVAIYDMGLNVYDPKTEVVTKYINEAENEKSLPGNQVIDIVEYGKDLLFGTNLGVAKFDRESQSFSLLGYLPEDMMVYAIEQVTESELWLGTYHDGLFIYDTKNDTYINYKSDDPTNPVADNLIYDILTDSLGRTWVATNNGLNMKSPNDEKFKLFQKESGNNRSLANNSVRFIYEDSKSNIWIGMLDGGVAYYSEKTDNFISFTEEDGMSSNLVTGIIEDQIGRIWVSTDNGISIIRPEDREIFYLTPDDGIGGWEFSSNAIGVGDGALMFGGVHGIVRIPSSYIAIEIPKPRVYITEVLLFQEPVETSRQFFNDAVLEFGAKDSYLEFEAVAVDFDSPSETVFSHKLEGFDETWVNTGTRQHISYSNLPAGDYELKIVCTTARNVVSDPVSLKFSIASAWYKTIAAYIVYFLLLMLVIATIVKLREGKFMAKRNMELAVINGKLQKANVQLEKLSVKDPLTNLFNRRYFDAMFDNYLKLTIRGNAYISLIMIDIDNFKDINDAYGHVAGDFILVDAAEAIKGLVGRATDFAARYGGDELVVVLYDTNCQNTMVMANKILERLRKVKIRDKYTAETHYITASIGVTCLVPKPDCHIENFIEAADKALYASKEKGRNCVSLNTNI